MNKVIKGGSGRGDAVGGRPSVKPVVLLGVEEMCSRGVADLLGEDPVRKARLEAEVILRTARAEAKTIAENAYSEGYSAGRAAGGEEATRLLEELESLIARVDAETAGLAKSVEAQLLKLCTELVEKIVRHEIRTDPRVVERTVKGCLKRVTDSPEVRVRVNPDEVDRIRALRDELMGVTEGVRGIHVVDDRRVTPGGCVIETASGTLDANIDTQLDKIEQRLMETYANDLGRDDTQTDAGPDQV